MFVFFSTSLSSNIYLPLTSYLCRLISVIMFVFSVPWSAYFTFPVSFQVQQTPPCIIYLCSRLYSAYCISFTYRFTFISLVSSSRLSSQLTFFCLVLASTNYLLFLITLFPPIFSVSIYFLYDFNFSSVTIF